MIDPYRKGTRYPIYVRPFYKSLWGHTLIKRSLMSHRYETSLKIFYAKPFDNGVYVLMDCTMSNNVQFFILDTPLS